MLSGIERSKIVMENRAVANFWNLKDALITFTIRVFQHVTTKIRESRP